MQSNLTEVNEAYENLLDSFDRAYSCRDLSIKRTALEEAKRKIRSGVWSLLGTLAGPRQGILPEEEQRKILEEVKQIPINGKKMVVLMEAEDGSGIVSVISGKFFTYK